MAGEAQARRSVAVADEGLHMVAAAAAVDRCRRPGRPGRRTWCRRAGAPRSRENPLIWEGRRRLAAFQVAVASEVVRNKKWAKNKPRI